MSSIARLAFQIIRGRSLKRNRDLAGPSFIFFPLFIVFLPNYGDENSGNNGRRHPSLAAAKKSPPPLPGPPLPPPKITAHMYIFCLGNNSGRALGGAGKETQQPLFTVIITSSSPSPTQPNPARLRPALFTRSSTFTCTSGGEASPPILISSNYV